jgi:uncharacterized membrane protein YhaH (DUF805 family)
VCARRLHDIGKSGWWNWICLTGIGIFLLIYWYVQPSLVDSKEDNKEVNNAAV